MLTRPGWSHSVVYAATAFVIAVSPGLSARTTAAASRQGTPKQLLGTLYVTDKKDVPLTDVTAGELEVKENGQSRAIQTAELDTRPLAVALVLDNNSELSTSFMQSVVPAGIAVVKALPPGTLVDIWTTGDRPNHVGKALSDPAEAEAALKGIAAVGTNTLLNAIADASKALPSDDNHRLAVIVMTTGTLGDTGGYFDRVLSVTAFEKRAASLVAIINAQYRIAWQPGMDPREATLDFKCSRKGTKVVAAQRLSAVW